MGEICPVSLDGVGEIGVFLLPVWAKDLTHDQAIELVVVSDKECPSGYGPRLGYVEPLWS